MHKDSLSRPLNATINQSIDPSDTIIDNYQTSEKRVNADSAANDIQTESIVSDPSQQVAGLHLRQQSLKHKAPLSLKSMLRLKRLLIGCSICTLVFLICAIVLPGALFSFLQTTVVNQTILNPDNEDIWAHFPGKSQVVIMRNFTFFKPMNYEQMLFKNQTPVFREIKGYAIQEFEDFFNIEYIQDGNAVKFKDWLYFRDLNGSKNLDQKVEVLNLGGLGYWYNIKVSDAPTLVIQGLSSVILAIEEAIILSALSQGLIQQYLISFDKARSNLFKFTDLSLFRQKQLFYSSAYGVGNATTMKEWVRSALYQIDGNLGYSDSMIQLSDFFSLSQSEMSSMMNSFTFLVKSLYELSFTNYFCSNTTSPCTGQELTVRQIAQSAITNNPPQGSGVQPSLSVCDTNITCAPFDPEFYAYYQNVYRKQYPDKPEIFFELQTIRGWLKYNLTDGRDKDDLYNQAPDALLHKGNLMFLWEKGTKYDQTGNIDELMALGNRFNLHDPQQIEVFWSWMKYLANTFVRQADNNQYIGIASLFSKVMMEQFTALKDKLNNFITVKTLYSKLKNINCAAFTESSFGLQSGQQVSRICQIWSNFGSEQWIQEQIMVCKNPSPQSFSFFTSGNLRRSRRVQFCQTSSTNPNSWGYLYHNTKIGFKRQYNCSLSIYCSDLQLALIQFVSGLVTLNPPILSLPAAKSFNEWDNSVRSFEYSFYCTKYSTPENCITFQEALNVLNFDNWYSSPQIIKQWKRSTKHHGYIRYISIMHGLNGFTMERSVRNILFGYEDQILVSVRDNYPPFGGDPSTPAVIALNDLNNTQQNTTLQVVYYTGKNDSNLVAQYAKINNLRYLNIQKCSFNGNNTSCDLISPWAENDYFYGTSAKQFAPLQYKAHNISLYVPNLQRYGSGSDQDTFDDYAFGFDLKIAYLGKSIYETSQMNPENTKYYQSFYSIFNETSVVGIPLMISKNHFMNATDCDNCTDWLSLINITDQTGNITYNQISHWDDSFVRIQPYTGVSFEATIFLQTNYYYKPDLLFTYPNASMLPVFSIYRSGNISESVADDLFGQLKTGLVLVKVFKIGSIIITVLLALFTVFIGWKFKKQRDTLKFKNGQSLLSGPNTQIDQVDANDYPPAD